ncbi:MAG: hypothetical protein MUO78_00020 [candidate division Zixibacteria bacterium]|nr:hypothetical protein [candidate division Zixibacteria bacterium]
MNNKALIDFWIKHHNEKYFKYLLSNDEPRYDLKTFFLNSFYLFNIFGKDWDSYLEKHQELFRRDPAGDYYAYRDPLVIDLKVRRLNAFEWATLFEIISNVGYPYNESAKENLIKYANKFLLMATGSPDSDFIDIMISSAVANLPDDFKFLYDRFPSQISEYIKTPKSPHQYIAYLNALRRYKNQNELKEEILKKLINWIKSTSGSLRWQINVWARLITRLDWITRTLKNGIQKIIKDNFLRTLSEVHSVDWQYSPMILDALYRYSDQQKRNEILYLISQDITPSSFFEFYELFPFINPSDEALDVSNEILLIKERCGSYITLKECYECIKNRKDDCWIRILSKITNTRPRLHSGYEVADIVIHELSKGIYIVIKAKSVAIQKGEGDVLYRQCVSLFSNDHALVFYLNPMETVPFLIEQIRRAASNSTKKPRFEVIPQKYIRQIYKKYKSDFD